MSGAETSFTDLMFGETMLSGDNPKGPCDAVSPLDSRNFSGGLLRDVVDGRFYDGETDRDRTAEPLDKTKAV
jgi:hypothetical protein